VRGAIATFLTIAAVTSAPLPAQAQVNVLANRYDDGRSGANLNETTLTTANVNVNRFGKLYTYPVDGAVYAQPLYVSGVVMQGVVRNVLYVATMNDKVYAFNADSSSSTPLWVRDFTSPPSVTAVPMKDIISTSNNIFGNVGIESTPVIDPGKTTLYLVARTKESGSYVQRIHALDITTGAPLPGSGVKITASVASSSTDALNGVLTFNPKTHQQRAGLALVNGVVLVSWAGHEDKRPYHGWIMGFDSSTLARVAAFCIVPDGDGGGIWQGGRAPAVDGNIAYFATGNNFANAPGAYDAVRSFPDTLLKLNVSRTGISVLSHFTPGNEVDLAAKDADLSGSGFTLLPPSLTGLNTNLLLGGGKEGVLYLLDANNLGGKQAGDPQAQRIVVSGGHVMGGPVYWRSPNDGPLVYNWSEDDNLIAYQLSGGRLSTPYLQGREISPGHPGGSLIVSANGSAAGTGIVWASMPTNQDAIHILTGGILRAYNAETLAQIWTSEQNASRDRVGTLIKFVPPVVVNGKVFMANHDNAVAVYGLLPVDFTVSATPASKSIAAGTSGTFTVKVGAQGGFAGAVALTSSGAPSGTTVTFSPQSIAGSGTSTMTVTVPQNVSVASFNLTVRGTSGAVSHTSTVVVDTTPGTPSPGEIVLWASKATRIQGNFAVAADPTAAGGSSVSQPNAGAPKKTVASADPANYFELTFTAEANRAYRIWIRAKAAGNSYNNDSVYVQFSGSVTSAGAPTNTIGTTQAEPIVLEDCGGCGVSGWGWQDNGYGAGVLGPLLYFTAGPQTIRIQDREDGIAIDQIVLSPSKYLSASPGLTKNDTTILPETKRGTVVMWASDGTPHGNFGVVADTTAAGGNRMGQPNAGAPKKTVASADPTNYFELTFTAEANRAYRIWIRGKAASNSYNNDSVYVQFSGGVTSAGAATNRIGTTQAEAIVLEDCGGCGLSGWAWQDNGYGVLGPLLYFTAGTQTIRIQEREDGISIDQIVLSPDTYLTNSPGLVKNDTTILNKSQ
jgi:hypothetical protein